MIVSRVFATTEDAAEAAEELKRSGFRDPAIQIVDRTASDASEAAIRKLGIMEPRAKTYAEAVAAGSALLIVEAPPGASIRAASVLEIARPGDQGEPKAEYEAITRDERTADADWSDATPLSRAIGWRVLLDNPAPFSNWIGKSVLSNNPTPLSSWLGRSVLSGNSTPLSSWLGWKTLTGNATPLSSWLGRSVLIDNPTPLSTKLGRQVLSDDPTPLSNKLNRKVLSDDPAPLSRWLNMPVLSNGGSRRP